jgi:endonuclease YncB( thermonuclease family)
VRRLLSAAALAVALVAPALAEIAGPPRIIDGRTLEVAGQRIRLFGIDAPDLDQLCRHGGRDYHCGQVARAALWDLVSGLDVGCAPETEAPGPDGTIAATCSAGEVSLNEAMVRSGWALADRAASDRYVAIEADAKSARRGLWKGPFEPPSAWRRAAGRRRVAKAPPAPAARAVFSGRVDHQEANPRSSPNPRGTRPPGGRCGWPAPGRPAAGRRGRTRSEKSRMIRAQPIVYGNDNQGEADESELDRNRRDRHRRGRRGGAARLVGERQDHAARQPRGRVLPQRPRAGLRGSRRHPDSV